MIHMLVLLFACGGPAALPQPNDPPVWPMRDKVGDAPTTATETPDVNGPAFAPWVEERVGTADADGQGPDPGSAEWTSAIHAELFGDDPDAPDMSSPAWGREVLKILEAREKEAADAPAEPAVETPEAPKTEPATDPAPAEAPADPAPQDPLDAADP